MRENQAEDKEKRTKLATTRTAIQPGMGSQLCTKKVDHPDAANRLLMTFALPLASAAAVLM